MIKNRKSNTLIKVLTVAYIIIITYLSLTPNISASKIQIWDKLLHLGEYSIFVILIFLCYGVRQIKFKNISFYLIIPIIYGIIIEFLQLFVKSRSMELLDISFNIIGVFIGLLFYVLFLSLLKNYKKWT